MLILGHRGASGLAPENTLSAFKKAFAFGVDGLEFDVQQCKSGEIVVFHDWTLERTTNGKGNLKEFTLDELKKLDAGSWFSDEFAGERIPTLKEVLDICPKGSLINIELKEENSVERGTEKKVADIIKEYPHLNIVVSSFSHNLLKNFKEYAPATKIGLLFEANIYNIEKYIENLGFEIFSVHPGKSFLSKETVDILKNIGKDINVWTVNTVEDKEKMERFGVTSIITNFPNLFCCK